MKGMIIDVDWTGKVGEGKLTSWLYPQVKTFNDKGFGYLQSILVVSLL